MSKKKKFLLWVVLLLVVVAIVQGMATIRHGFSTRANPSWIEIVMARSARRMAVPASAQQMTNPIPNTAENLAGARAHWADHCATCHANNGSGDTEIGKNLYPKAPDMRLPATQNLSDGELYYTIQNGIRLTGMPAWGEPGPNDQETWRLVHFIRHLPRITPQEEQEMERLNPKGPEARKEEQEEQEFLNQSPAPAAQPHRKRH